MGLLTKNSLTFCVLNLLRAISVVAICLSLAGEIVTMVSDLKGVEASKHVSTASPAVASATNTATMRILRRSLAEIEPEIFVPSVAPTAAPATFQRLPRNHLSRRERLTSTSSSTASKARVTRPAPNAQASTSPAASETQTEECSYIGGTSVSKGVGGVLFSTLERIFIVIILLFSLAAEMPPPSQWTQRFWSYAFPPFGESFGTGVLGMVQVFVGCTALSHFVTGFPLVSFWFLFITGFLNILFGLSFGAPLKSLRSILPSPSSPHSVTGLARLRDHAAPHAGAPSSYYNFDHTVEVTPPQAQTEQTTGSSAKREKRAIRIAPTAGMVQVPAPPIYRGEQ